MKGSAYASAACRRRRIAGPLVALAVGLALVASAAAQAAPKVSVLERPQTAADQLPAWVLGDLLVQQRGLDPASSRLAFSRGSRRFFVATARPPGVYFGRPAALGARQVCLLDVPATPPPLPRAGAGFAGGPGGSSGMNCQDARILDRYMLLAPFDRDDDGFLAAGLVPDGYTRVSYERRTAPVRANVFVIGGIGPLRPLIARGPAGRRVTPIGLPNAPLAGTGPRVEIGLLDRPKRSTDALPSALLRQVRTIVAGGSGLRPQPRRARSATAAGIRFWLIPDADPDVLSIVTRGRSATGSAGSVGLGGSWPRLGSPILMQSGCRTRPGQPFGPQRCEVYGIAGDGYTSVVAGGRRAPVRDNVFVLGEIPVFGRVEVTFRGSAGVHRLEVVAGGEQARERLPSNFIPFDLAEVVARTLDGSGGEAVHVASTLARARAALAGVIAVPDGRDRLVDVAAATTPDRPGQVTLLVADVRTSPVRVLVSAVVSPDVVRSLDGLGRVRPLSLRPDRPAGTVRSPTEVLAVRRVGGV